MKVVAFIPLRGGSKGIPGKNIRPLAGKPLCQWTIEAAVACEAIDRIFVSTDSPVIRATVVGMGFSKVEVVDRSPATATDTATTESAMIEFSKSRAFDEIVLIQATSPLLTAKDLEDGIAEYRRVGADSLLSVVPQKRFLWAVEPGKPASPQNYDPLHRPRRQDFQAYHVENGAFYITRRLGLLEHGCRLFGTMAAHVMPEETFIELDEPADWLAVETMLKERGSVSSDILAKARRIKLIISDVDGVLTDSGMYYSETGDELKKFNTRDGKGFELLRNEGIKTAIITSEDTKIVERRAAKLKIDFLYQGARDKMPAFEELLAKAGVTPDEVAYVGDDLADIPVLQRVGLSICPQDAIDPVVAFASLRTQARGGEGVVREAAELILKAISR